MRRRALPACFAAFAAVLAAGPTASATGMQGHIFMAQCAAEQIGDDRLLSLLRTHELELANGAFFPDSGYASEDHDQGEIAHWEGYVEGTIQVIRERYAPPFDGPEAGKRVAFLMGLAAHGITDSTFDALLYARADQVDPGDMDVFDLAMDVFLVHDMPRYFVPDFSYDAEMASEVFTEKVDHPVTPDAIEDAMSTARTGIAAVTNVLAAGADDYGNDYPWARASLLDPRVPGSYGFGARVVTGYYREILRRLDGDASADEVVIGTYPGDEHPLATLDATRPDGRIVFFFGHGLERGSVGPDTIVVEDEDGVPVPVSVDFFRGDEWPNVLVATASTSWAPGRTYKAVLSSSIRTLNGTSPSEDYELTFTTCTPDEGAADCAPAESPAPALACPETIAKYAHPDDPEPEDPAEPEPDPSDGADEASGPDAADAPSSEGEGCALTSARGGGDAVLGGLMAAALAACAARRRRR